VGFQMTGHMSQPAGSQTERYALSARRRKWTLVVRIVAPFGLLGDTSAILMLAVVAAATSDPRLATASFKFMRLLIRMSRS
jgi:hypothetical protein